MNGKKQAPVPTFRISLSDSGIQMSEGQYDLESKTFANCEPASMDDLRNALKRTVSGDCKEPVRVFYEMNSVPLSAFGRFAFRSAGLIGKPDRTMWIDDDIKGISVSAKSDAPYDLVESNVDPLIIETDDMSVSKQRFEEIRAKGWQLELKRLKEKEQFKDPQKGVPFKRIVVFPSFVIYEVEWRPSATKRFARTDRELHVFSLDQIGFNADEISRRKEGGFGDFWKKAEVVGRGWKYANRDGSPDMRKKDNEKVNLYGLMELTFSFPRQDDIFLLINDLEKGALVSEWIEEYLRVALAKCPPKKLAPAEWGQSWSYHRYVLQLTKERPASVAFSQFTRKLEQRRAWLRANGHQDLAESLKAFSAPYSPMLCNYLLHLCWLRSNHGKATSNSDAKRSLKLFGLGEASDHLDRLTRYWETPKSQDEVEFLSDGSAIILMDQCFNLGVSDCHYANSHIRRVLLLEEFAWLFCGMVYEFLLNNGVAGDSFAVIEKVQGATTFALERSALLLANCTSSDIDELCRLGSRCAAIGVHIYSVLTLSDTDSSEATRQAALMAAKVNADAEPVLTRVLASAHARRVEYECNNMRIAQANEKSSSKKSDSSVADKSSEKSSFAIEDDTPESKSNSITAQPADTYDSEKSNQAKLENSQDATKQGPGQRAQDELVCLLDELDNLVGLDKVKQEIRSLANMVRVRNARIESGLAHPPMSLHLVFTGRAGTGKTTVARLLGQIYKCLGVLSEGHMLEVDRSQLVAGYLGQTAIKVQEVLDKAKGGILFIDEAYTLAQSGNADSYGQEAIDSLMKTMEDQRSDLVVIAAGYPDEMDGFLESNPGLRSRFNRYIDFPDYDGDELFEIFMLLCRKSDYKLDPDAEATARRELQEMKEAEGDKFANGRSVRNYFERTLTRQADRLASASTLDKETLSTILSVDLDEEYFPYGKPSQSYHAEVPAGQPDQRQAASEPDEATAIAEPESKPARKRRASPFRFSAADVPIGSKIQYLDDPSIEATVVDDRRIEYMGEVTSLSALAQRLQGLDYAIPGPIWFTYEGELLSERRMRIEADKG